MPEEGYATESVSVRVGYTQVRGGNWGVYNLQSDINDPGTVNPRSNAESVVGVRCLSG